MWTAKLKNGQIATETGSKWVDIKGDIETLSFDYNDTKIDLPPINGKIKGFVQYKSGSASLLGGPIEIESQTIGVILDNGTKLLLRFHFKNNKIETIVE